MGIGSISSLLAGASAFNPLILNLTTELMPGVGRQKVVENPGICELGFMVCGVRGLRASTS